jgi:hypothetical protein
MQRLPSTAVTGFQASRWPNVLLEARADLPGWAERAQAGLMGSGASRFSALSPPPEHACRAVRSVALCKAAPHRA